MDPELANRLDGLTTTLRTEIAASTESLATALRAEIAASAANLVTTLRAEIAASATTLHAEIAASAAETRRHFDVVADRLMDKIQLVGEGVIGVDQKLDRFRDEVGDQFRGVDRRLLRLEAKLYG